MSNCCKKYEGIVCAADGTPLFAYSELVNGTLQFTYYDAVTGSEYTGGFCTTCYTETFVEVDPFFNASPAAGITSTDITNWNAKVDEAPGDGLLYGRQFNGTNYVWAQVTGGSGGGIPTGGTTGQILAKASATNYDVTWIDNYTSQVMHVVKLNQNIATGQAVYVSGSNGTNMLVQKADNTSEATSSKTLGLLLSGGVTNDLRYVITEGLLTGTGSNPLNTSTATAGDPVWLGTNGNLLFGLLNKPVAPNHMVFLGIVTRVNNVNGEIFVKVQNGYELDELHDVSFPGGVGGVPWGAVLYRDSINNLWKAAEISTILGYTPMPTQNTGFGSTILTYTNATPNDSDVVVTVNSSTNAGQKISWTNVKAFLKTYFDTIYTTTSAVATQITTALSGYATLSWVNSQGFITNVVTALGYTPANVTLVGTPAELQLAASDEITALTTTGTKITFRMPHAMSLTSVRASLTTAQSSGSLLTVDVRVGGTTVFSTLLTFDNTEKTTMTAATPAVLTSNPLAIADDAELTVHITQVGASGATGLKITLKGNRA